LRRSAHSLLTNRMSAPTPLPPGQQLVAPGKWPFVGEREPRVDDSLWNVTVTGAVARPHSYSLDELRSLPQVERTIDIHCVTRCSKLGARFSGVSLAGVLRTADVHPAAKFISFVARSERAHSTSLTLADALRLDTLLALTAEGATLPVEHG